MEFYDFAIGWQWEYDEEFCRAIEGEAFSRRKLRTYLIHEGNIDTLIKKVRQRRIGFGMYMDRAFDVDDRFALLGKILERQGTLLVNAYDKTAIAIDKASMHLQFLAAGLYVPFSIIISPYADAEHLELTFADLAHLGRPFIIKPANTTGGGIGVVTGAETLAEVLETRKELVTDKYLLQEKIDPLEIGGRRCWFRCFYVFDKVFLAWWDDLTHIYALVTRDEEHYYKLSGLRRIMKTIARVSGLQFFSSEIALRRSTPYEPSRFIVIDYVNDLCDMRSIETAHDGLPNALRQGIVERLVFAAHKRRNTRVRISSGDFE